MPTLKHKFDIGETVYVVRCGSKEVRDPCPTCSSSGIDRSKFSCRGCSNRGYIPRWIPDVWEYHGPYTIGQVTIIRSRPMDPYYVKAGDRNVDDVIYMMHETGVGSGTCYNEKDLVRGEEKAKKECAQRQKLDDAKKIEKEATA